MIARQQKRRLTTKAKRLNGVKDLNGLRFA
jgi:hypothetical protein